MARDLSYSPQADALFLGSMDDQSRRSRSSYSDPKISNLGLSCRDICPLHTFCEFTSHSLLAWSPRVFNSTRLQCWSNISKMASFFYPSASHFTDRPSRGSIISTAQTHVLSPFLLGC